VPDAQQLLLQEITYPTKVRNQRSAKHHDPEQST
jgi:hypothetical protein